MSKHTPGPWFRDADYTVADRKGNLVADCNMELFVDEAAANTRLIAAAPDLLAALQACVGLLREVYGMLNPEATGNETLEDWLKEAKTAIAKAEGKHD